jgi:hypothetical protein
MALTEEDKNWIREEVRLQLKALPKDNPDAEWNRMKAWVAKDIEIRLKRALAPTE